MRSALIHALMVTLILCAFRFASIFCQFDFYNDLLFFIVFSISLLVYQSKNRELSFLKIFIRVGFLQIGSSILVFEIMKLILIDSVFDEIYLANRIIISLTILVIGLLSSLPLLLISLFRKK